MSDYEAYTWPAGALSVDEGTGAVFIATDPANVTPSPVAPPSVLATIVTSSTIGNTSAESTLYTYTFPQGDAQAGDIYRFTLWGDHLNNTGGNRQLTARCRFGGTQIATVTTGNLSTSTNRRSWRFEAEIAFLDPIDQWGNFKLNIPTGGSANGTMGTSTDYVGQNNAIAIDTATGNRGFTFTIAHSLANAQLEIRLFGGYVLRHRA